MAGQIISTEYGLKSKLSRQCVNSYFYALDDEIKKQIF